MTDLLELLTPKPGKPKGMTVREIMAKTGRGVNFVREKLKRLYDEGIIEVFERKETDVTGRQNMTYEYRVKKGKK